MTTYNTPEEPAGPVWDEDGNKWSRLESGVWLREGATWTYSAEWYLFLHRNGPLTDTPPVKVGDKVTFTEFSKMPNHSVAGSRRGVFINFEGSVFTGRPGWEVDLSEIGDDVVTVLRVGEGEE